MAERHWRQIIAKVRVRGDLFKLSAADPAIRAKYLQADTLLGPSG